MKKLLRASRITPARRWIAWLFAHRERAHLCRGGAHDADRNAELAAAGALPVGIRARDRLFCRRRTQRQHSAIPSAGPYDLRLGYASLPSFEERLLARGFAVTAQARGSAAMLSMADQGLFFPMKRRTAPGSHCSIPAAPALQRFESRTRLRRASSPFRLSSSMRCSSSRIATCWTTASPTATRQSTGDASAARFSIRACASSTSMRRNRAAARWRPRSRSSATRRADAPRRRRRSSARSHRPPCARISTARRRCPRAASSSCAI